MFNDVVASRVSALLLAGSPTAVPRIVSPAVVNPVEGESWRAAPHVFEESRKAVLPPLANCYSPACIVFVRTARRTTAAYHTVPDFVFSGYLPATTLSMRDEPAHTQTAATAVLAAYEFPLKRHEHSSTEAAATRQTALAVTSGDVQLDDLNCPERSRLKLHITLLA
jgi:hypothetical protein